MVGKSASGERLGWVVLSTDVVDVKAYSGKPLITLVGLDPEGVITGARVVWHSEPILLVGIPEQALHDFVSRYVGHPATSKFVVGKSTDPHAISLDIISGATVTALAQNKTTVETARALGGAVGVIEQTQAVPGHFVRTDARWSWQRLLSEGVFGRLTLTDAQMGMPGSEGFFIDLYFTIADAPQVGIPLLGEKDYEWFTSKLGPDEHLVVVLGNGASSFKGSGFVRGGIFDRVRIEQGLSSIIFTDKDYTPLSGVAASGAPEFREGAVFIAREGRLDPGAPFDLVFIGSRYDGRGAFSREFHAESATLALPSSVYVLDGPDPRKTSISDAAWRAGARNVAIVGAFLALVLGVFAGRRWSAARMDRIRRLHVVAMLVSFGVLGLGLHAQPSITQVLTFAASLVHDWRWELFLSEPVIFVMWIFIAVTAVVWGRGVFCGWVCPYGTMTELVFKLGRLLRLPSFELPEGLHHPLRHLRYVVLVVLVAVFFVDSAQGELLAEVEPFKSTFFVRPWAREVIFFGWWLLLVAAALVWWRPFCRYLCPLGAALALPASLRLSGPYRRNFCKSCTICTRQCEPRAIRGDGSIDPRECLSCMECEANFNDREVCPPLVGVDRLLAKSGGKLSGTAEERLKKLEHEAQRW